jgi:exosortase/archaeosortase family protein
MGGGILIRMLVADADPLVGPALALQLAALAAWQSGRSGLRRVSFPACLIALSIGVPRPIADEAIWQLQLASARGAAEVLTLIGRDFTHSGVILRNEAHTFHVIDACSGWNGLGLLLGAAVIVVELLRIEPLRALLLVLAAPVVAFGLNVLRVAYVAASPNPEALAGAGGDHSLQGVMLIAAGTCVLYGLGLLLSNEDRPARGASLGDAPATSARAEAPPPSGDPTSLRPPTRKAIQFAWAGALLLASWLVSAPTEQRDIPSIPPLPEARADWRSEPAPHDPYFTGTFASSLNRRFEQRAPPGQPSQIVDVLIARAPSLQGEGSRLFSSKRWIPGPEWDLVSSRTERLWRLGGREVVFATSTRPTGEVALVYTWTLHDGGWLRASLRDWLGETRTASDGGVRTFVRLTAYAPHDGQLALDLARQRLDRFAARFRPELDAL